MKACIYILLFIVYGCSITDLRPADFRDKFVGKYMAEEESATIPATSKFTIHISKSAQKDSTIYIKNFWNADITVKAKISGSKLSIPEQQVNEFRIVGLGTINGQELTMSYWVNGVNSTFFDDCRVKSLKN
jgi:inner membrane protein involved in colicin E2 resistance